MQSEFAKQQRMDAWQLGRHLASNLEVAAALLQDKLSRIRSLEQQVLHSTELKSELERVKTTYSIGRILHLMRARHDITQALMLTSPAGDEAADGSSAPADEIGAASSRGGGRAARLKAISQQDQAVAERSLPKAARVRFKGDKIKEVLNIARDLDADLPHQQAGKRGGTMRDSQTEPTAPRPGTMLVGAGQSTGFLKVEAQRIEAVLERIRVQQLALTAGDADPSSPLRAGCPRWAAPAQPRTCHTPDHCALDETKIIIGTF